jgi:hypothetical protein
MADEVYSIVMNVIAKGGKPLILKSPPEIKTVSEKSGGSSTFQNIALAVLTRGRSSKSNAIPKTITKTREVTKHSVIEVQKPISVGAKKDIEINARRELLEIQKVEQLETLQAQQQFFKRMEAQRKSDAMKIRELEAKIPKQEVKPAALKQQKQSLGQTQAETYAIQQKPLDLSKGSMVSNVPKEQTRFMEQSVAPRGVVSPFEEIGKARVMQYKKLEEMTKDLNLSIEKLNPNEIPAMKQKQQNTQQLDSGVQ